MGLKLIGEVALDGSGFERGLGHMAESVKGFVAGAFGLYGVEAMLHKTFDTADQLVNASKRLGVGVEPLQVLAKAAADAGSDLGTVETAFEKIDKAREKALSGSKEGMKLLGRFAQLGISKQDLQTQTAANLFTGPMSEKAKTMNPEDLTPILKDVMGKSAGELVGVLKTDFGELSAEMKRFGAIMDADTAVTLKVLGEEAALLGKIFISELGPAILKCAEVLYILWMNAKGLVGGIAEVAGGKVGAIGNAWDNATQGKPLEALKSLWQAINSAEDVKNFQEGANAELDPMADKLEAFKAKFAELADELEHPKAPKFDVEPAAEKQQKQHKENVRSDAMISVGNFLGSSMDVLEDIGRRQVDLLQQIANNTRPVPEAPGSGGMGDDDFGPL